MAFSVTSPKKILPRIYLFGASNSVPDVLKRCRNRNRRTLIVFDIPGNQNINAILQSRIVLNAILEVLEVRRQRQFDDAIAAIQDFDQGFQLDQRLNGLCPVKMTIQNVEKISDHDWRSIGQDRFVLNQKK